MGYNEFLYRKSHYCGDNGFEPIELPEQLFPFQRAIVEKAIRLGRSAILADCGLGKTIMQLTWADNVARHTGKPVLVATPLAVSSQTVKEARKFGFDCERSQDGTVGRAPIIVTNYERLKNFNAADFAGFVGDEASILKHFGGQTQKTVTRFVSKLPYRLLCTATAAPNDYVELGTLSEALGELSYSEMLRRFFKQLDDKGQKSEQAAQDKAEAMIEADNSYYQKLAFRVAQTIGQWRLKHHAVREFWRWVASWAVALRKPSDVGFSDDGFILPGLVEQDHIITPSTPPPGFLFQVPSFGMAGERQERRRTLDERCEFIADLVKHDRPAVVWCHLDAEGDRLEQVIEGAMQVSGKMSDEMKCDRLDAFAEGRLRVLVVKPKIACHGLNWQHCAHVVTFASHSYEQYYQAYCRCYRFGQKLPVRLDVVATEGEARVLANMRRKAKQASNMFSMLVSEMQEATRIERTNIYTSKAEVPSWL